MLWNVMGSVDIENNIFYHNGTLTNPVANTYGVIACDATGGAVQIRNNLFYLNTNGARRDGTSSLCDDECSSCTNCLAVIASGNDPLGCSGAQTDDPMFVNPYGDWHIAISTPHVVGAGLNLSNTVPALVDFDGHPRSQTNSWDVGAYVYK
jgi:hypothetical protein